MGDADIFSKLSRILETHSFDDNDPELDIDQLLNDRDRSESFRPSSSKSYVVALNERIDFTLFYYCFFIDKT